MVWCILIPCYIYIHFGQPFLTLQLNIQVLTEKTADIDLALWIDKGQSETSFQHDKSVTELLLIQYETLSVDVLDRCFKQIPL